ncbi:MAG: hypothetical protein PHG66_05650 [Candidatus Colwellbacteria bacterium]|nr:hypothetical protein [Candidatus Colwellbacteria bacterium]
MKKASIIGGGEIGRAIASLLALKGIAVSIWDKDPSISQGGEEKDVLKDAEAVFFCVPSWCLRDALASAKEFLFGNEVLVFVSKGLEKKTGLSSLEITSAVAPLYSSVFIGGPMIAEEISSGKGGAGVVASDNPISAEKIREAISSPLFDATIGDDPRGVVFSGVLKNVYAMLLGASEGLGYGVNIRGWLVSEILTEMAEVVAVLGGDKKTPYGPAGLGDLIATGSGPFSSNWKAGFSLASGHHPEKVSEGMSSFDEIHRRLGDISRFRFMSAIGDIMAGLDPKTVFKGILSSK